MILTARLLLEPATPEDADGIRLLAGDEAVARSALNIPHPFEEGMTEAWIGGLKPGDVVLAIRQKGEDPLIGMIGLIRDEANESAELSYWIGRPYWGHGFASEAAAAVVEFGFRSLGLNRIFATTLGRNAPSARVLEKAGFTPEGSLRRHVKHRGQFEDLLYYGLLREEYERLPPSGSLREQGMITYLGFEDMQAVLGLASQVENLFGPMIGIAGFEAGLEECLKTKRVLGCKVQNDLCGAAIVDREGNELCWFVVDSGKRGQGIGARMLEKVIGELDSGRDMTVQTFAPGIPEGEAARRLYMKFGFADRKDGGLNPAGIPTVIMVREKK